MSDQPRPLPQAWTDAPAGAKPDGVLVGEALAGDGEAFRQLVQRHQQAIHAYLYRLLLRDLESAQDLTQSVFLKAYRGLHAVDRTRPLLPWLYRIAHNEAANHLRTRARHPEAGLAPEDWARVADPRGETPEGALAEQQEHALRDTALHQALAELKPALRGALMLHYFEERSYQEIAEALRVPIGTVGTLIHRGRKALRKALAGQEALVGAAAAGDGEADGANPAESAGTAPGED